MTTIRWRMYRTAVGRDVVRDELDTLGQRPRAAILTAMKRVQRNEHAPYEQEHIGGELYAVRVFVDQATFRMLYARVGAHDHILLGLHVLQKKDRKLPLATRRLAQQRLNDWQSRGR